MNIVSEKSLETTAHSKPVFETVFSDASAGELKTRVSDIIENHGRKGEDAIHKLFVENRFIMVNLTVTNSGGRAVNVLGINLDNGAIRPGFNIRTSSDDVHNLVTDMEEPALNDLCVWLAEGENVG